MRVGLDDRSLAQARGAIALMVAICLAAGPTFADEASGIGGIGHIVPAGGILAVSAPAGDVLVSIAIRSGQQVKRGDLLATLDSDAARIELAQATQALSDATAAADARNAAQAYAVQLANQKAQYADQDLANYRALGAGARTEKDFSVYQAAAAEARFGLAIEQAKQQQIRADAEATVAGAEGRLELAKSRAASDEIRAPIAGTILNINHHVGERLTGDWLFQIADLSVIDVNCQIYEGDLLKIAPGKKATIKSAALAAPLSGKVQDISRLIDSQARLGTVVVQLDTTEPAARLINMEVDEVIER
jgi:HlyD family secretion protein